jgi:uncharacterized protein YhhL (DUF1145 family)
MFPLLKLLALVIYALAIAALAGRLPGWASTVLPAIAGLFLVVHVVELAIFWRHIRLYQGTLALSVLLTLLFGVMHWKPLANAHHEN